jgi:hypothetical protein
MASIGRGGWEILTFSREKLESKQEESQPKESQPRESKPGWGLGITG